MSAHKECLLYAARIAAAVDSGAVTSNRMTAAESLRAAAETAPSVTWCGCGDGFTSDARCVTCNMTDRMEARDEERERIAAMLERLAELARNCGTIGDFRDALKREAEQGEVPWQPRVLYAPHAPVVSEHLHEYNSTAVCIGCGEVKP